MRKEVFYSLAALSLAPVAANAATDGTIIPEVITGDNWVGDLDVTDATKGIVQWCKDKVSFTYSKSLVKGSYTIKAKLTNKKAAVKFFVNGTIAKQIEASTDENKDIEVPFTLDEDVTSLTIEAQGVMDFEEGKGNDYFLTIPAEGGLSFDMSNFTGPLAEVNKIIDTYANKVANYQSEQAKMAFVALKEKKQQLTTADVITYDFYAENLADLSDSPLVDYIYEKFNEATLAEANYQAGLIEKKLDEAIEGLKDADGNETEQSKALAKFAQNVKDDLKDYTDAAKDAVDAANAQKQPVSEDVLDVTKVTGTELKALDNDAKDVVAGVAYAIALKIAAARDAYNERVKDLNEKFGTDPLNKYLEKALEVAGQFNSDITAIEDEATTDMEISSLTDAYKTTQNGKLDQIIGWLAATSTDLKPFYTVYDKFMAAGGVATLKELIAGDNALDRVKEKYNAKATIAQAAVDAAQTAFAESLPDITTATGGDEDPLPKLADKTSMNTLTQADADAWKPAKLSDNVVVNQFNSYVDGLDAIDVAWKTWNAAEEDVAAAVAAAVENEDMEAGEYDPTAHFVAPDLTNKGQFDEDGNYSFTEKKFESTNKSGFETFLTSGLESVLDGLWKDDGSNSASMKEYADYLAATTVPGYVDVLTKASAGDDNTATYVDRNVTYSLDRYVGVTAQITKWRDALSGLKEKLEGMDIYAATPATAYELDADDKRGTDLKNKTWKEVVAIYQEKIDALDDQLEEAMTKTNGKGATSAEAGAHSLALRELLNSLTTGGANNIADDPVLSPEALEKLVKDGGALDNEEASFAELAPKDTWNKLIAFLSDTDGALFKLDQRIKKDDGTVGDFYEDGDYKVGYDTDFDGKIDAQANLTKLEDIKDFKNVKSLTAANNADLEAKMAAIKVQLAEAQKIYDDNKTDPTTKDKYEKANAALGEAVAIINELNDIKLRQEFEPLLMAELQRQAELLKAREELDAQDNPNHPRYNKNGDFVYNAGAVRFDLKLGEKWSNINKFGWFWNQQMGVSGKTIAANAEALRDMFRPTIDAYTEGDEVKYAKAIEENLGNARDKALYDRLEEIVDEIAAFRGEMDESYAANNVWSTWKANKEGKLVELNNKIAKFVDDVVAENARIEANEAALLALQTLSNYDSDENGDYDWNQLIKGNVKDGFEVNDPLTTQSTGYQAIAKDEESYEPQLPEGRWDEIKPDAARALEKAEIVYELFPTFKEMLEEGGSLYNQLQAFVDKVNQYYNERTLDEHLAELKEEFEQLSQNILLIDEHAQKNNDNYKALDEKVDALDAQIAAAEAKVGKMPSSAAKTRADEILQSARNEFLKPYSAELDIAYKNGEIWQDAINKQFNDDWKELSETITEACDLATGEDNFEIVKANNDASEDFEDAYWDATRKYYQLVGMLDQLKNLENDANVKRAFATDAKDEAAAINEYLFGSTNDNPKDVLDKQYNEGMAELARCNAANPAEAWSDSYSTKVNAIKTKLETYIGEVKALIATAVLDWTEEDYLAQLKEQAWLTLSLNVNHGVWFAWYNEYKALDSEADDYAKKVAALQDKYTMMLISRNADFNNLYTEHITKVGDDFSGMLEKVLDEDGKPTAEYTTPIDLNALFAQITFMENNFTNMLLSGTGITIAADFANLKSLAESELAEDAEILAGLELTEEDYEKYDTQLQGILEKYNEIVLDKEGNAINPLDGFKDYTTAIGDYNTKFYNKIAALVGYITSYAITGVEVTSYGLDDWSGEHNFVHQLYKNASDQSIAAVNAALTNVENALKAAQEYIAKFKVSPDWADDIQALADQLNAKKKDLTSAEAKASTRNLQAEASKFENEMGTMFKDAEDKIAKLVAGTLSADLKSTTGGAWNAEKTRLTNDINELRSEYKQIYDNNLADAATLASYDEQIDALLTRVQNAKITIATRKANKVDVFDHYEYDDLAAIQADICTLYNTLRAVTGNNSGADAILADLNARIATVKGTSIESVVGADYAEFVATDPDVAAKQAELDNLVAAYEAAAALGNADYNREKLTDMVLNAENKLAQRDLLATIAKDLKEAYDKFITDDISTLVEKSKKIVNGWVDGLASEPSVAAEYGEADELLTAFIATLNDLMVNKHNYGYKSTKEYTDGLNEVIAAIDEAENEAANLDLTKRLEECTAKLEELQLKYSKNAFDEADANVIRMKLARREASIKNLARDLAAQYAAGTADDNYETDLALIESYTENAETGEMELTGGIKFKLNELSELLGGVILGDVTGDGKVTLADAGMIVGYVLGDLNPMPTLVLGTDEFRAWDINGDGVIDLADAGLAVNLYLYGNVNGREKVAARGMTFTEDKLSTESYQIHEGLTRLAINLDNAAQYMGFQMDVQLPDGVKLAVASLGERAEDQFLRTHEDEGTYRIVGFSYLGKGIQGDKGAVLYLDLEVAEGFTGNLAQFGDVFFVTTEGQKATFNLGNVTPTGIKQAETDAENGIAQKIYDLGGRMKSSLKKGVNIIKDAAGNAKKVMTK